MSQVIQETFSEEKFEEVMAQNIFYIEKELGAYITDDYPLAKLNSQLSYLTEHFKMEKAEAEKAKRRR